ncbi:hypothetical protein D3C83_100590 [compost metagenome]
MRSRANAAAAHAARITVARSDWFQCSAASGAERWPHAATSKPMAPRKTTSTSGR